MEFEQHIRIANRQEFECFYADFNEGFKQIGSFKVGLFVFLEQYPKAR